MTIVNMERTRNDMVHNQLMECRTFLAEQPSEQRCRLSLKPDHAYPRKSPGSRFFGAQPYQGVVGERREKRPAGRQRRRPSEGRRPRSVRGASSHAANQGAQPFRGWASISWPAWWKPRNYYHRWPTLVLPAGLLASGLGPTIELFASSSDAMAWFRWAPEVVEWSFFLAWATVVALLVMADLRQPPPAP